MVNGHTSQICSRFSLLQLYINPKFIKLTPRYLYTTRFLSHITENHKHVDILKYIYIYIDIYTYIYIYMHSSKHGKRLAEAH